jgi:hypothetical protein
MRKSALNVCKFKEVTNVVQITLNLKVSEAKEMIKGFYKEKGVEITSIIFESDAEMTTLDKLIATQQ